MSIIHLRLKPPTVLEKPPHEANRTTKANRAIRSVLGNARISIQGSHFYFFSLSKLNKARKGWGGRASEHIDWPSPATEAGWPSFISSKRSDLLVFFFLEVKEIDGLLDPSLLPQWSARFFVSQWTVIYEQQPWSILQRESQSPRCCLWRCPLRAIRRSTRYFNCPEVANRAVQSTR